MTASATHREAVEAMHQRLCQAREQDHLYGATYRELLPLALDAIPASVLARLAVERGALEPVSAVCARGRCQHVEHWHRDGTACKRCECPEFVPVYRITDADSHEAPR